jgi:hypothetical protein
MIGLFENPRPMKKESYLFASSLGCCGLINTALECVGRVKELNLTIAIFQQ